MQNNELPAYLLVSGQFVDYRRMNGKFDILIL